MVVTYEKDIINSIVYAAEIEDKSEIINAFEQLGVNIYQLKSLFEKQKQLINFIHYKNWSVSRRQLILCDLYLYRFSKNKDIFNDQICKSLREKAKMNEEFNEAFYNYFKNIDFSKYLNGQSMIKAIIQQEFSLSELIDQFVFINLGASYVEKIDLNNLRADMFRYPGEQDEFKKLDESFFKSAIKNISKNLLEQFNRVLYTGNNIKITNTNFPDVYALFKKACKIMNCNELPELYLMPGYIGAITTGIEKPMIIMDSGSVSLLTPNELLFIFGHEIGHIKCQHYYYETILQLLPYLSKASSFVNTPFIDIKELIFQGFNISLYSLFRKFELTADRAGLLCCQDMDTAIDVLMKISGLPISLYGKISSEEYLKQIDSFSDITKENKTIEFLSKLDKKYPWTILRAKELNQWYNDGNFESCLNMGR